MKIKTIGKRTLQIISAQKAFFALILICLLMLFLQPAFYSTYNIFNILKAASTLAIIGFGEALVIICGGCDLSVGGIMCFAGVVAVRLMEVLPLWLALILAVLAGSLVGVINGFLVVHQKTEPFVITLGMGLALTGICLHLTDGRPIYSTNAAFQAFGSAKVFGIPSLVICMLVIMAIMYIVLRYTQYGRNCYAVGGDYNIAVQSGLPAMFTKWSAYILSGVLSSIGGILLSARLNSASAIYGETTALLVCCSVVLGGTSFSGGTGGVVRTAIGVLLFTTLENAMPLFSVFSQNVYLQQIVKALMIILVVGFECFFNKRQREKV